MLQHVRSNLWILLFTLVLCCLVYPLVLWAVGHLPVLSTPAQGSLVTRDDGNPVGSRLIAQPFKADEYFWPRPSAASYNASASGGSNLGASNPALRDRVARTLGPIVKYEGVTPHGNTVQKDVADWVRTRPNIVADWAEAHPTAAQAWVNADDQHKALVTEWQKDHPEAVAAWKKDNPGAGEPKLVDLAVDFFKSNAAVLHKEWKNLSGDSTWSLEAVFFEMWLQAHPYVDLEQVPADLVTTSGSGLDPHITLKGALYQLDRVAAAWAKKTGAQEARVKQEIEALLNEKAFAPLSGLAGVPLVNVLEVNLELADRVRKAKP
jgi:K+-transporting ATPase ATPase C chain